MRGRAFDEGFGIGKVVAFFSSVVVIIYHHWCGVASLEGYRAFVVFFRGHASLREKN